MEFNQGEFDSVTQRLEQYASQVSVLQTKLEMQPEIESLKKELNIIQAELDKVKAERDELAVKTGDYTENGTTKSKFRKTGAIML